MTVSSTTNQVIYTGSGGSEFEFTFGLFATSDLVVKTEVIATGVQATLTETTDYTVDETELGIGYADGGKVTLTAESFPDGLSSAYKIILKRVLPLTQEIDLVENDPTRAEVVEEAFDRSVMTDQQLQEQIDRCIKVSETASEPTADEILASISASAAAAAAAETGAKAAQDGAETAEANVEAIVAAGGIVKGDGTVNPTNLLSNGNFESWSAGASAAPDGWTLNGAGASVAREATTIKLGTYSVAVTRAGDKARIYQINIHSSKGIDYWKGRTVTFGCWVKSSVADTVRMLIWQGNAGNYSDYHSGSGEWEFLTVTRTIGTTATLIGIYLDIETTDQTAYFDGAMLVEGSSAFAFSPKPAEEGVWADYSAVSTIVGWSSFDFCDIRTRKIGSMIIVAFYIYGPSNSTSTSITIPYTTSSENVRYYGNCVRTQDNGTLTSGGGLARHTRTTNVIDFYKDMAQTEWTASGPKSILGHIILNI